MSPHRLTIEQASDFLSMDVNELHSKAVQGEIPCHQQGKRFFFDQEELDLWRSKEIIGKLNTKKKPGKGASKGRASAPSALQDAPMDYPQLHELCATHLIEAEMQAKCIPAVLKELVKLAETSDSLYLPKDLFEELLAREQESSTAIGFGVAIPHPKRRIQQPNFEDSFVCVARLEAPIFFGSETGDQKTDIFFLVCCLDSNLHLATLARIGQLIATTSLAEDLRQAENASEMYRIITEIDLAPEEYPMQS
jgi:mannitol/fructose-specific phosphotransferase system IIA component (Ntr-type)